MRYYKKKHRPLVTNVYQSLSISCVRQPSLVDSFYIDKCEHPETGVVIYGCHNPLYMLFNQQRLDRLGSEAIRQWIEQLDAAHHSEMSNIRKQIKDEDLIRMIKDRNIQHPCELERYISELDKRADLFNSEIARVKAEMELENQKNLEQQVQPQT